MIISIVSSTFCPAATLLPLLIIALTAVIIVWPALEFWVYAGVIAAGAMAIIVVLIKR